MSSISIDQGAKSAVIFGSTGLVGRHVLHKVLAHNSYKQVIVFNRRKMDFAHSKLVQHVIDFDRLDEHGHLIKGDDFYMCLGTTRAKAGSWKQFIKVDLTYTLKAIKYAKSNGVNQLLLISSVGADPSSSFSYAKIKGYLEFAVKEIPFWSIHIFRPSVLLGNRTENRLGEQLVGKVGKIIHAISENILKKYQPIEAETVATAMVAVAQMLKKGVNIYPSNEIENLI